MATRFEKVRKSRNLYEEVMKEIRKSILTGKYTGGLALPSEPELAKQFGVSRPVVREALRSLQSSGYLEIRRGTKGGTFVRDLIRLPHADDFPDLILYRRLTVDHLAQTRLLIEPEICRLAAQNATHTAIKEMKELIEMYGRITSPDEKDQYYTMFHRLVGRACGNPLYAIVMESIMDFTEGFIRAIKPVSQFIHKDDDHDEIIVAIENRDGKRAAEVGLRHAMQILAEMRDLENAYLRILSSARGQEFEN